MEFFEIIWNNALAFFFVITVIVFVHEMGHFLVARYYGVGVKTFSIGFGPEILGYTGKQTHTRYRLSLIPLGGYVAMYGEQNKEDEQDSARSFATRPPFARAAIIIAGPLANFILGFVLISCYMMIQGVNAERIHGVKIDTLIADSVAEKSELLPGDMIERVNGKKIRAFAEMADIIVNSQGKALEFTVKSDNSADRKLINLIPELRTNDGVSNYFIGIQVAQPEILTVNLWQAITFGSETLIWLSVENLRAIGQIIVGDRSTQELGGPIKIATITKTFAQSGIASLLFFTALLSINLGLINLMPIPLLDGGHLVFIIYEMLARKPLPLFIKERLMQFGFAFILTLMIFVTINDILSF